MHCGFIYPELTLGFSSDKWGYISLGIWSSPTQMELDSMERRTAKIHEAMREWGHENAAWLRKLILIVWT